MSIDLSRVRITGPLSQFAPGFAKHLSQQGYRPSQARRQMWRLSRLSDWLVHERLGVSELCTSAIARFLRDRRAAGYSTLLSTQAMRPILSYLGGHRIIVTDAASPQSGTVDAVLGRYRTYLLHERGIANASAGRYLDIARSFLQTRLLPDRLGVNIRGMTAADIVSYVVTNCPQQSRGTAKLTVTVLRSLLGFLHVDGAIAQSLTYAVPSASGRRLVGLPKGLEQDQLRRLLASCNVGTYVGCRDFAIMTMLVRLGLRAAEVARLQLDDIDWRSGEIVVHGKGNRTDRLPLPADVGDAIATYLRSDHPRTTQARPVFVRIKPPHDALTTGAVTQIVARAAQRCGLGTIHAHRLRHTAATMMLRGGASLPEIGQLLRHRLPITTAIYAKVDREALRAIARPWPGEVA